MTRHKLPVFILSAAMVLVGFMVRATDVCAQQTIAYTDATIETMGPDGRLDNATLVVRGEKIVAVGTDIEIPGEAELVSMSGKTIIPGIVDPYFVFRQQQQPTTPQPTFTGGRRFRGFQQQRFSAGPFIKVGEYFYPYESDFRPAVRSGITTANLVTDGRGLSALAHLDSKPDEQMLLPDQGFLFAKVTNETSALDILRNGLEPEAARGSGRGARSRGGRRGGFSGRRPGDSGGQTEGDNENQGSQEESDPNEDETKALWTAVREGTQPLVVNVNNAATVAHVLKLLGKFEKVRLYLVSTGPNVYPSLDEIKSQRVTIVLQPGIDEIPFTTERMNVSKLIADRQIPLALSLSLNEAQMNASQDDPLFPVSALVKTGLSRQAALEALTIKPAQMLGIDKTHGSLAADKMANCLVFDGDPLATGSVLRQVIVKGRLVHEN